MNARAVVGATLLVLGVLVAAYLLWQVADILVLVVMAILLSTAVEPLADWLGRGPRPLTYERAVPMAYLLLLGGLALTLALVVPSFLAQGAGLVAELPQRLATLQGQAEGLNPPLRAAATRLVSSAQALTSGTPASSEPSSGAIPSGVVSVGLSAANGLVAALSTLVIAYYWSTQRVAVRQSLVRFSGPRHANRSVLLLDALEARLSAWVRGQVALMAFVAVAQGIAYVALGLPGAAALALWAGLAELIPVVGPPVGAAPALLVALTISPSAALVLLACVVVVQFVEGYVLYPRVMGKAVGVSPLAVFVGILVGGQLGGITGALLAVPVTGTLQLVVHYFSLSEQEVAAEYQAAKNEAPRAIGSAPSGAPGRPGAP
jgi:predicted PurR-regulated permease PerM